MDPSARNTAASIPFLLFLTTFYVVLYTNRQDKEKTQALLQQAQEQLVLLKRQVVLGQMYPSAKSVMDS